MNEAIRLTPFGEKDKILLIDESAIQFQSKNIQLNHITGIRYGINLIEFYRFSLGRKYQIGIKTATDQLDFTFKSYLGIDNEYFSDLYSRVIDEIWDAVVDRIWDTSIDLIRAGKPVFFGNCQVSKEGISFTRENADARPHNLISWEDLYYEKKYNRLVLNSKSDYKIWTNLYFENTWNVDILMAILDWVTKENGLAELQK